MKRFFLLFTAILGIYSLNSLVFGQNNDYYQPDSTNKKEQQAPAEITIPSSKEEVLLPKKKPEALPLPWKERVRIGGSFGVSLGTVTNINLSPMAGYELTEKLLGGVGATLMWYKSSYFGFNSVYYGGRAFLMYSIIPMVNIQAEYEAMNVVADTFVKYDTRKWLGSPMLGASYSQPLGGKFTKAIHMTLLYNFSYDSQLDDFGNNISPYSSPFVFRITFL
jgi:hypothetical protein